MVIIILGMRKVSNMTCAVFSRLAAGLNGGSDIRTGPASGNLRSSVRNSVTLQIIV
jgi:hypothetical protein